MAISAYLLENVALFQGIDRKHLARLARDFQEVVYEPGDTVVAEGSRGTGFFVIETGTAVVSVRGKEVGRLHDGQYFGEIAVLDDGPRSATITAVTRLVCDRIESWPFRAFVQREPDVLWKLLQTMAARLRIAERKLSA